MNNQVKFDSLRNQYKTFNYDGYNIERLSDRIRLSFNFSVDGLCSFCPSTEILTDNLTVLNAFNSPEAEKIVFSLGLVELISYWKAVCPPTVSIRCGNLSESEILWWKKLWFGGLGEFFYINGIDADFADFLNIELDGSDDKCNSDSCKFRSSGLKIVPVGGGKDSAVTLSLLSEIKDSLLCFTVNDQPARTGTVLAAGLSEDKIIKTYRTIDRELLRLNSEGFLNGHTPFSAIVAFLGLYCAYLVGADSIILSNESSANESTVGGAQVNHQYSKSFAFESDFTDYVRDSLGQSIKYFSLLRAFNELQIAKYFAGLPQYHEVFRSCNAGSKKNVWCGKCAKCLFVYIILSPFLSRKRLTEIFGRDMLCADELTEDFRGLTGITCVKPFECIGTVSEVNFALLLTLEKYKSEGEPLPPLLEMFEQSGKKDNSAALLSEFNRENNIPAELLKYVEEMYAYVSGIN